MRLRLLELYHRSSWAELFSGGFSPWSRWRFRGGTGAGGFAVMLISFHSEV